MDHESRTFGANKLDNRGVFDRQKHYFGYSLACADTSAFELWPTTVSMTSIEKKNQRRK